MDDVLELIKAAVEKHGLAVKPPMVPGFALVEVTDDIEMPVFVDGLEHGEDEDGLSYTLPQGAYHVRMPPEVEGEEVKNPELCTVANMRINGRSILEISPDEVRAMDEAGESPQIDFDMTPARFRKDGRAVTMIDLLAWAAIGDALDEGNVEAADRIVRAVYLHTGEKQGAVSIAQQETLSLTGIRPTTTYWPIDKVSRHLTDPDAWGEPLSLDVGRPKGKTFVQLALSLEGRVPVTTSETLDHRDREIIAAVDSLKIAATSAGMDAVISAANVCEAMGELHPEPARQAEVEDRMRRLTDVKVTIDFTEEALKRHLPMTDPDTGARITRAVIRGRAIEARIVETTDERGKTTTRFRLLDNSPSYRHAHEIKQVASWDNKLLSLPAIRPDGQQYGKSSTPRQTSIKHGVLEFVAQLKRGRNRPTFLSYDALCRDIGVNPSKRSSRKEVVDFAEGYLRALQKAGEVKDYQTRTVGRAHKKIGVDVFV